MCIGSSMADLSACHRAMKRQLFRRNESLLLLVCMVLVLYVFYIYQNGDCENTGESIYQFGLHRNEHSISREWNSETFLFIMILASPKGKERRDAIRKTWLSNIKSLDSSIAVRFVIGVKELPEENRKNLKNELETHNDILFLPELKDSYFELTTKVLQAIKWIDENVKTSYLLKVDDDSFVRLDVVLSELKSTSPSTKNLYWGFFRGDAHVKFKGSWAEKRWHLCDRYLPYAQGGGYILSGELMNFIARNADLLQRFNSEDVSVGAWLAPLQVSRVHDYRFNTEYRSRGCNNQHIVSHKQSIDDMYQKHKHLQEAGKLCSHETHLRNSFVYNWAVPPSQCCKRVGGIP